MKARAVGPLRHTIQTHARAAYSEAILAASERLFLRDGYHATRMIDVAKEAGVAVGTLYKHFPSKDALFEALAARGREEALELLRRSAELPDPKERLRSMVVELFAHVERQNAVFAVLSELGPLEQVQLSPEMRAGDDRTTHEIIRIVEGVVADAIAGGQIRADIEPVHLAAMFEGVLRGTLLTWLKAGRSYPLSSRAEPLLSFFFEGASAR